MIELRYRNATCEDRPLARCSCNNHCRALLWTPHQGCGLKKRKEERWKARVHCSNILWYRTWFPPFFCCNHKKTIGFVHLCFEPNQFYVFLHKISCVTIDTYSSMIGLNAGLVYWKNRKHTHVCNLFAPQSMTAMSSYSMYMSATKWATATLHVYIFVHIYVGTFFFAE